MKISKKIMIELILVNALFWKKRGRGRGETGGIYTLEIQKNLF